MLSNTKCEWQHVWTILDEANDKHMRSIVDESAPKLAERIWTILDEANDKHIWTILDGSAPNPEANGKHIWTILDGADDEHVS